MNFAKPVISSILLAMLTFGQPGIAAEPEEQLEKILQSALQTSIDQQQRILQYQEQLAELEIEFGGFDQRLMETLQGLSEVYIEARDYDEAHRLIDRRLQLIRTIDGPSNLIQLPIIHELIENDIRRGEWETVAERFEYIYWMHSQNADTDTEVLMAAKDNLKDWHLTSLFLGDPRLRVRSFQKARALQRENFFLAKDIYAEDSVELVPWLYKQAMTVYQVAVFLEAEDELGKEAREDIAQRESRDTESYLREGLNAIKDIRDILAATGDLQAEAMAMIYEADFQMIMSLGTAPRLYRAAMDKLREAGIEEDKITEFFMRPAILPVNQFYHSLDEVLAKQNENGYRIGVETDSEDSQEIVHLGDFIAWIDSAAFAERPRIPELASSIPIILNEIELRFNMSSPGYTLNPRPIASDPDTTRVRRDAREAVKKMQFRPRFVNGRWKQVKGVTLRYLYPPKLN